MTMKKVPKTIPVKVLQGNYGYGWDDLIEYDAKDTKEMKELRDDFKTYRENEPNALHRIISRRISNPKYIEG